MGRASKNYHRNALAGKKGVTKTTPSSGNRGLPVVGNQNIIQTSVNPPGASIPTGRKDMKRI